MESPFRWQRNRDESEPIVQCSFLLCCQRLGTDVDTVFQSRDKRKGSIQDELFFRAHGIDTSHNRNFFNLFLNESWLLWFDVKGEVEFCWNNNRLLLFFTQSKTQSIFTFVGFLNPLHHLLSSLVIFSRSWFVGFHHFSASDRTHTDQCSFSCTPDSGCSSGGCLLHYLETFPVFHGGKFLFLHYIAPLVHVTILNCRLFSSGTRNSTGF
mmetsp:Transcript_20095/g.29067  ORF Transcript_20095/g.29067 Transcript_20095/m.29067 type:complete len:210 (-) Transcript_20095:352-981(-)